MITPRNEVVLVGCVGSSLKFATAQSGKHYVYFALEIEARANAKENDRNYHQTIHVMCFKKHYVDYLQKVKAKQGNSVVVFGFASSYPSEVNGKQILANGITANEVYVVKKKADKVEKQEK